ncbi:hypothetical protein EMCRGX_G012570 [Ephydatia muelleri]
MGEGPRPTEAGGGSVSLLRQEIVLGLKGITRRRPPQKLKLVTASGESLPIVDYVEATVVLGNTEMKHYFVVVKDLITPVILGVDFLQDKAPDGFDAVSDGFDAVSVQNVGSTYIIVSWDLPTHSNGILINFSLYCNGALAGVLPLTVICYDTTGLLLFTVYMYITLSVGQVLQSHPQALHSSWNVVLGVISAAASLPRPYGGAYSQSPIPQLEQDSHYIPLELAPALEAEKQRRSKFCAALSVVDDNSEEIEGCTIPTFDDHANVELPEFIKPCFNSTVQEFKDLFIMTPGTTNITCHKISTNGPPVRVPPRRIPAHFRTEVESQIQHMLQKGIIVESSSSWMAPAVYVRKKSGELCLCVDYRKLNKRTHKDAYPLPLVDEVQDRLSGSVIFSKLDLQSGYWQVPVDCVDQEKTAFCPGPGMGLFQFTRMPFGLSGAPSSFQRLMNIIMRGLPFVSTYIDDVLIHSESEELHKVHLREAFKRLRQAGLTLRGVKCQIGMSQVTYLGHVFSGNGMTPDGSKIRAVTEWPKPVDAGDIRQFLGLASYYRRYINRFADLAAPLHQLTHNNAEFQWTEECNNAFESIK